MMTDYKVIVQQKNDQGDVIYQKVVFFEGEMRDVDYWHHSNDEYTTASTYVRTNAYEVAEYHYENP